jgi:membrane protein
MWSLLKEAALGWIADSASRLSAALAYYTVFSLAPLLVIVVFLIGLFYGEDAARGQVSRELSSLMGPAAAETIESAIAATSRLEKTGWIATATGVVVLLFGATSVFGELKSSLNHIWRVQVKPGRTVVTLIRDRFLSFSLVLCVGFLLVASLLISAVLALLSTYMSGLFALPPSVWQVSDFFVSLGVTGVLFAMIFKVLPNVQLAWQDVLAGGLLTALLFTVGKSVLAWYLGTNSVASSFGAAGALVVILLWFYYTTTILFFGAEFTKAWVRQRVGRIIPQNNAYLVEPPRPPEEAKPA